MSATAVRVTDVRAVDHPEAMALAAREYERLAELVDGFHPDDWSRPTDCPEWDVRSMVAHVLGGMEACASVRQNVHQMRLARKESGNFVDALGTVQIRERASLSTDELLARLRRAVPRAVSGRRRVPGVLRRWARMHVEIQTFSERWPLGYLIDVIYTRDTWMHRVDLSRATGRDLVLTPEHDGRIVADIVADWARRHGQPFTLRLAGAAGGLYAQGTGGEQQDLDAVEFARIVSGRAHGPGLLTQEVPF